MGLVVSAGLVEMTLQLAVTTASFRSNVDVDKRSMFAFERAGRGINANLQTWLRNMSKRQHDMQISFNAVDIILDFIQIRVH